MSAKVVVYLGPARSGKTHELLQHYRDAQCTPRAPREERFSRSEKPTLDRVLWLAPNGRTAALVRSQLVAGGLDACLRPGIVTFRQLTDLILTDTPERLRRLPPVAQRELLRRVINDALAANELALLAEAARRSGFILLLAEHFGELKRRGISPAAYAKARPPRGDVRQHHELALLYSQYDRQLTTHGLCDAETAHSTARDALATGGSKRFQNLELVVVDGFTDFTPTQHDLLRLLAQRTKQVLIALPHDSTESAPVRTGRFSDESKTAGATGSASAERTTGVHWQSQWHPANRPDLFAKASATLNELRRHLPQLELRPFAARPADWPALEHLTTYIFGHPGQVPSPSAEVLDSLNRIELVEAAGAHDEIVEIARRIKERLVSGQARPSDIVVAFRSLADVAPRVREVFDQFGIPYYLESDPPLVHTALLKVLLDLVRLDAEDWPFRQLVSIVTNNTLTSLDAGARQAADWLVRDLQIAQGRRALLERVDELAAAEPLAGLAEYARRRAAKAQEANPVFTLLADALDGLPQEATPAEWCQALSRAATALGLPPFARRTDNPVRQLDRCFQDGQDCPSYDPTDLTAWQSLVNHFAALERLDAWLGQPSRKWSRFELTRALVDAAAHETLPRPNDDVGRVRILPAPVARNVPARHLFLAGMSELAFPSPERAGRLATEADYNYFTRVADQDLASTSTDSATRSQEEMLLFYEVLSRAEESLTISYPALDEQGQSLPPSPYVVEIERMLGDEGIKSVRRCSPHLSPIPRDASAYSLVDWRTQAIAQALDGDCRLLAGMLACESTKPLSGAIDAGIRIVHARAHGESFGPAEGVLRSPAVAARLAQRFGPQHLWSPSQWETYAACPYKFFLEGVLGLEPLGDLVLETDLARRGSRLHHVLAAFHREWPDVRTARSLTPQDEAQQFLDHLHKVIDERIAVSPRGGIEAALLELDRRQLRKWAAAHFDHHAKYDGTCAKLAGRMTPAHFEFRFGPPRPGDENDPDSVQDAFVLDIDGEQIRITGQIDRVDVGTLKGHAVFNVIDYKSGRKTSLKSEHIESGEKLQLPIYVEAAQMLLFGGKATPLVAGYWSMTAGFDSKGALAVVPEDDHAERWQSIQATTHRLIQQFVHAIRNGEFPVASRDDKCTSYCDFNTVCRISQIRSLNKTWPPETKP